MNKINWKSEEFWNGVVGLVVMAVGMFGVTTPGESAEITTASAATIGGVFMLVAAIRKVVARYKADSDSKKMPPSAEG